MLLDASVDRNEIAGWSRRAFILRNRIFVSRNKGLIGLSKYDGQLRSASVEGDHHENRSDRRHWTHRVKARGEHGYEAVAASPNSGVNTLTGEAGELSNDQSYVARNPDTCKRREAA